jgi:hypothetical protein
MTAHNLLDWRAWTSCLVELSAQRASAPSEVPGIVGIAVGPADAEGEGRRNAMRDRLHGWLFGVGLAAVIELLGFIGR